MKLNIVVCVFLFVTPYCNGQTATTAYDHGNPTALEQYMLELINRARINPASEGVLLDQLDTWYTRTARTIHPEFFFNLVAEFASYPAVPPLAFNHYLIQSARAHADDMLKRNYFTHQNPEGQWPSDRAQAAGYTSSFVGENMNWAEGQDADDILYQYYELMVDYNNIFQATEPLGHRLNFLNGAYREIGIGNSTNLSKAITVQDLGNADQGFILGVVYADLDSDGFYSPGEGLAGIRVAPSEGQYFAITSVSGGYAIPFEVARTNSMDVALTVPAKDGWNDEIARQEVLFRQNFIASNSVPQTITITASGGVLKSPLIKNISIVTPVMAKYNLTGTDGWFFRRAYITAANVKVDFPATAVSAQCVLSILNTAGSLTIQWSGGQPPYQLQQTSQWPPGSWQNYGAVTQATNSPVSTDAAQAFYRVLSGL